MNKIKTLKIIITILAVLNIGLLIVLFLGRPPIKNKNRSDSRLQKNFNFTETQMTQFRESKENHIADFQSLKNRLDKISTEYYQSNDSLAKNKKLDEIITITRDIYFVNDNHFSDIRSMCKEEQLDEMEKFISSLIIPRPPQKGKRK